jgi:hypothetical protein
MSRPTLEPFIAILLITVSWFVGCGSSQSTTAPSSLQTTIPSAPPPIAGAIQVAGVVYDTAIRNVSGARVEVLDGPQAGVSTIADSEGRFSFSGVFDDGTRFRATKEGLLAATATMSPFCMTCNPHRWLFYNLEQPVPPADIAGDYNVTFVTDSSCTSLPNELHSRTYAATIALAPPAAHPEARWLFVVIMKGVPFFESYREFRIGVAGDYLGFPDNDGPTLVEKLAANTYLAFNSLGWANGVIAGASAGATITTSFISTDYCVLNTPLAEPAFRCIPEQSRTHIECRGQNRLVLTRR